jgi:hypothetical protein
MTTEDSAGLRVNCVGWGPVNSEAGNKRLGLESRANAGRSRRVLGLPMSGPDLNYAGAEISPEIS